MAGHVKVVKSMEAGGNCGTARSVSMRYAGCAHSEEARCARGAVHRGAEEEEAEEAEAEGGQGPEAPDGVGPPGGVLRRGEGREGVEKWNKARAVQ